MDLSVLIPARNEMFLSRTVEDVLSNIRGDTEIIVVLDGAWADPPIQDHERVNIVYHPVSVGQRAATNEAARLSSAKYVMKLDAHCSVGEGFDVIMMEDMQPDWTMVPMMYNLHAFDWLCQDCGHRTYQGPTPEKCAQCGGPVERDILWRAKPSPCTTAMRFDRDLKFQYWSAYKKRQNSAELRETMSILGACWMLERDRYFKLNICDEKHGSWGQQGTEVACKTWLSGGRLVCTTKTWFAHMFRTQGGDFGFPYPISGNDTRRARAYSHRLWNRDQPDQLPNWSGAKYSLSWLIERFAPVPDWEDGGSDDDDTMLAEGASVHEMVQSDDPEASVQAVREVRPHSGRTSGNRGRRVEEGISKGIVYYTDNRLDPLVMKAVQAQLERSGLPVVSASLEPLDFGQNLVVEGERGPLTMFRQILAGLEASTAQVVFLAEHDIIYHKNHWEFQPPREDLFYYNNNLWKVDLETGKALFHYSNHTSQLCAYRSLLLEHYRKRVAMVEASGFSRRMGYEPGTHGRAERVDDYKAETWMSEQPNLDIRHSGNLTKTRWKREEFRNQRYTKGWVIQDHVDGWYEPGGFKELLDGLSDGS